MKNKLLYLTAVVVAVLLTTSCAQTSYGYASRDYEIYNTNTNTHRVNQSGVTVQVENPDISYNLDLRAVANVFADSRDLEEFEMRLNDYETAINNLDLNRDGQVDYLRVIETTKGNTHLVVLQAVLDYDVYQDVASIAVDRRGRNRTYVQIIGDPYLYGPRYIIEPIYIYNPPIFSFFWGPGYYRWHSPYYWGYYPTYYTHWHPIPYRVYANNVNIYIDNSRHVYNYTDNIRSNNYSSLHNSISRNDLARQRPDRSFASRNARANVNNRRDLDRAYRASANRRSNINNSRSSSTNRNRVSTNRRSSNRGTNSDAVNRSNRSSNRNGQVNRNSRSTTNRSSQVNRNSRSTNNGAVRTNPSRGRSENYNSSGTRNSRTNRSSGVRSRSTNNRGSSYSNDNRSTRTNNSSVRTNRRSTNSRNSTVTPTRRSSSSRSTSVSPKRNSSSSRSTNVSPRRSSSNRSSGVSSRSNNSRNSSSNSRNSNSRSSRR